MKTEERCNQNWSPKSFTLALQALAVIASAPCTCPSSNIAEKLQAEPTALRRMLAALAKAGILDTKEGRDGGYRLRHAADTLTLDTVYTALGLNASYSQCANNQSEQAADTGMKDVLGTIAKEMDQAVLQALRTHTLAELVCDGEEIKPGSKG